MRPANGSAVVLKTNAERFLFVVLLGDFLAVIRGGGYAFPVSRRRHVVYDEIEDEVRADIVQGGSAHHREKAHVPHAQLDAFDHLLGRERAIGEELFHQVIVGLGHHLHQGFVSLLRLVRQLAGMSPSLPLPSPSGV